MRIVRILSGLVLATAGIYLVIAAHQKTGASSDPIQAALLRQNSALITAVDQAFFRAEQRVQEVVLRNLRKDPATATILAQPDSPRIILFGNDKIKASDFLLDAQLLRALELHRHASEKYKTYSRDGIQFILVRGEVQNEAYAAAFTDDALFQDLGVGEAMRFWIASSSGELLFHSVKRLMGSQVANLRPVASGTEMLAKQEQRNLVSHYTGFEGGDALGAWSVVPKRNLILGVEWAGSFGRDTTLDLPFFAGVVLVGLGCFLLGFAFRRRNKKAREKFQFDPASLDEDVVAYLEENRAATEEAVLFAQKKEAELRVLDSKLNELGAAQNELEWRLGCYESLFEQAGVGNGRGRLRGLAEVISKRVLGAPVILYRFSSTSFSLVPEWISGGDRLSTDAKEFLSGSRIFLGNFRQIGGIEQVSAFQNWNQTRLKYSAEKTAPVFLPMDAEGYRGAMAVLMPEGANARGELNETLNFFRQLVQTCARLCDTKQQLIQSRNDSKHFGSAMASTPNRLGNPAPEAQT